MSGIYPIRLKQTPRLFSLEDRNIFRNKEYSTNTNLSKYIVDSSKRLIDISLERTYTLKGKKIKLGE